MLVAFGGGGGTPLVVPLKPDGVATGDAGL